MNAYGPDGRPLDGPRTTAAEYAARGWLPLILTRQYRMWRNAADDEGARYAEAIRGARAMRHRDYETSGIGWEADDSPADDEELRHGSPWYFASVVQRVWRAS